MYIYQTSELSNVSHCFVSTLMTLLSLWRLNETRESKGWNVQIESSEVVKVSLFNIWGWWERERECYISQVGLIIWGEVFWRCNSHFKSFKLIQANSRIKCQKKIQINKNSQKHPHPLISHLKTSGTSAFTLPIELQNKNSTP